MSLVVVFEFPPPLAKLRILCAKFLKLLCKRQSSNAQRLGCYAPRLQIYGLYASNSVGGANYTT